MKEIIDREEYVFGYSANDIRYPKFIQELTDSYKSIKKCYPQVKDEDIYVEFEGSFNNLPMKLTFSALETDEEYAVRTALEKITKENMRKHQIQQLKKFLAENPELKEEFLNG